MVCTWTAAVPGPPAPGTQGAAGVSGVGGPAPLTGSLHLQSWEGEREPVLVASASWLFVLASGKDQNNS